MLSLMLPATVVKCGRDDVFAEERVCVHVYNHEITIPEPLLKRYAQIPTRDKRRPLFQIGISELLVCTTSGSLLSSFPYFWPLTRQEFQQSQNRIAVKFQLTTLTEREDLKRLRTFLEERPRTPRPKEEKTAILAVMNDYTKYWIADVLDIWRESSLDEVVLFKDPTQSPYLCDYPAMQKGFRRPPQ